MNLTMFWPGLLIQYSVLISLIDELDHVLAGVINTIQYSVLISLIDELDHVLACVINTI